MLSYPSTLSNFSVCLSLFENIELDFFPTDTFLIRQSWFVLLLPVDVGIGINQLAQQPQCGLIVTYPETKESGLGKNEIETFVRVC